MERSVTIGIRASDWSGIVVDGCVFGGFDVFMDARDSANIYIGRSVFPDVGQVGVVKGVDGFEAEDNLHFKSPTSAPNVPYHASPSPLTAIALACHLVIQGR